MLPNQPNKEARNGAMEINDLTAPLTTSEKDRGLQTIISLPSSIENNLSREAVSRLQVIAENFLQSVLLEAQRLAAADSEALGVKITDKHITQAEVVEGKRHLLKRDRWAYVRDFALAGIGAGLGNFSYPELALALLVSFGFLFLISSNRI